MRNKNKNIYIILFFIVFILLISFFIYNKRKIVENLPNVMANKLRDDKGNNKYNSRIPILSNQADKFNYGIDTRPGAINESFQIQPPVNAVMSLANLSNRIISTEPLKIYFIFYGNWSNAMTTTVPLIQGFVADLSQSSYLNAAVKSYSGADNLPGSSRIEHAGSVFDTRNQYIVASGNTDANRTTIDKIIEDNILNGRLPLDNRNSTKGAYAYLDSSVYCVLLGTQVRVDSDNLSCGWHGISDINIGSGRTVQVLSMGITNVNYVKKNLIGVTIRDSSGALIYPFQNCSTLYALRNFVSNLPNRNNVVRTPHNDNIGESFIDAFTHELVEIITDPNGYDGWIQTNEVSMFRPRQNNLVSVKDLENADLCAYNYGSYSVIPNRSDGSISRVAPNGNGSYTNVELKTGKKYFLPTMFVKREYGRASSDGKCLFGRHAKARPIL
jgi:hypothetical protein